MLTVTDITMGSAYAHDVYESSNKYNEISIRVKDSKDEDWKAMSYTLSPEQCNKVAKYVASLLFVDPQVNIDFNIPATAITKEERDERDRLAEEDKKEKSRIEAAEIMHEAAVANGEVM